MALVQVVATSEEAIFLIDQRGFVFPVIKKFLKDRRFLSRKIFKRKRSATQKDFSKYVTKYPYLIALTSKIIRFYRKGRRHLDSCLKKGSADAGLLRWDSGEKCDRTRGIRELIKKNNISKYIANSFLKKFFLAAPELFIESEIREIDDFFDKDLYFLGRSQKELDALHDSLKEKNPEILKEWLNILGF